MVTHKALEQVREIGCYGLQENRNSPMNMTCIAGRVQKYALQT